MIYRAHYVIPITQRVIEGGEVLVRHGRIEAIGTDLQSAAPDELVLDLGHAAILPGFVNTHTHLDYTFARGMGENAQFFPWIEKMTQLAGRTSYEDFLASCRMGALQLVRSGVTTLADITYSGAAVSAVREAGLRGIVYQETFGIDPNKDYSEQIDTLAENIHQLSEIAGDKIIVGVTPHTIYTSSERYLNQISELAFDENLPIAIHVAESMAEIEFIQNGTGPIADFHYQLGFDVKARHQSPVEYLHELGILGKRTLTIHCVHVSESDLATLAEKKSPIAHCPKSNAMLGVGIAPFADMISHGIVTGLGTDSAVSNNALDMFEEMRSAVFMQRAVHGDVQVMGAERILEIATLGGATALGLENEIGSLEPGKKADLIGVALSSASAFPSTDPYSALVYACSSSDVVLSVIDGEHIYEDGRYAKVDASEIRRDAAIAAAKV